MKIRMTMTQGKLWKMKQARFVSSTSSLRDKLTTNRDETEQIYLLFLSGAKPFVARCTLPMLVIWFWLQGRGVNRQCVWPMAKKFRGMIGKLCEKNYATFSQYYYPGF